MLYYVTRAGFSYTMWRFLRGHGRRRLNFLRPITYEGLFTSRSMPIGHYIFTDFDRLTHYENHYAALMARALQAHDPAVRILNDPAVVLERYALLKKLHRAGINDFDVTRLEGGDRPTRYPVFIRCEDHAPEPDSGLLFSAAEVEAAITELRSQGISLKRRIAVGYSAERSSDGDFRKYGVVCVGERVIPQHVLRGRDWYVKSGHLEHDAAFHAERLRFFNEFPHAAEMRKVMALANMQYGRVDYGMVGGRVQVYEINSNPKLGGLSPPANPDAAARRKGMHEGIATALAEIEATKTASGVLKVRRPEVRFQTLRRAPFNEWIEFNALRLAANFTPTRPKHKGESDGS